MVFCLSKEPTSYWTGARKIIEIEAEYKLPCYGEAYSLP
jgi:hypothetical protein